MGKMHLRKIHNVVLQKGHAHSRGIFSDTTSRITGTGCSFLGITTCSIHLKHETPKRLVLVYTSKLGTRVVLFVFPRSIQQLYI